MVFGEQALPVRSELAVEDAKNVMRESRSNELMVRPTAELGTSTMASTLLFLPPPLKSSAAMRAASTDPMPLVSWKIPEMSLSTPTRTMSSEISACAVLQVTHVVTYVAASAATQFQP